jgi:dephospho-CoA kinase
MAPVITVRPLQEDDWSWRDDGLRRFWGGTAIARRGELADAGSLEGLVAVRDGQRVGLLTYALGAGGYEIVSLHAEPEGLGVGRALMDAAHQQARLLGAHRMWLITTNENHRALRFYQRWGMSLAALHLNAVTRSRLVKPSIPLADGDGLPIEHELELERGLVPDVQARLAERVVLCAWREEWAADFGHLAALLQDALGHVALRVDHIGSTSVPGLAAKDVIDVQVVVAGLDRDAIVAALGKTGFTQRPGEWNQRDHVPAGWAGDAAGWDKLVFAPPSEHRAGNVHVRVAGRPNERYALLFRDFLRADSAARQAWGRFKAELAQRTGDLASYGAVKDPATDVLLAAAERWAEATGWEGSPR